MLLTDTVVFCGKLFCGCLRCLHIFAAEHVGIGAVDVQNPQYGTADKNLRAGNVAGAIRQLLLRPGKPDAEFFRFINIVRIGKRYMEAGGFREQKLHVRLRICRKEQAVVAGGIEAHHGFFALDRKVVLIQIKPVDERVKDFALF